MNARPPHNQFFIGLGLLALMVGTRFHHFGDALHLPDATWAIFFAAGFYLTPIWLLGLFAQAFAIDYVAIEFMGVSSYCVTPAYVALLPAYATLWLGGRWTTRHAGPDLNGLAHLSGAALASIATAFIISNGAFYWFGGRVMETNLAEFAQTFIDYAPHFFTNTLAYLAAATLVHIGTQHFTRVRPITHAH